MTSRTLRSALAGAIACSILAAGGAIAKPLVPVNDYNYNQSLQQSMRIVVVLVTSPEGDQDKLTKQQKLFEAAADRYPNIVWAVAKVSENKILFPTGVDATILPFGLVGMPLRVPSEENPMTRAVPVALVVPVVQFRTVNVPVAKFPANFETDADVDLLVERIRQQAHQLGVLADGQ